MRSLSTLFAVVLGCLHCLPLAGHCSSVFVQTSSEDVAKNDGRLEVVEVLPQGGVQSSEPDSLC